MNGEQLTHSPYLQCLASLAVGLDLDKVLCQPEFPAHHKPPDGEYEFSIIFIFQHP
jgi:hypothetical protein